MTEYLISENNPTGRKLEEILRAIRNDVFIRCSAMMDDGGEVAEHVIHNNTQILPLLAEATRLAEDSTVVLGRSFGEDNAAKGTPPSTK